MEKDIGKLREERAALRGKIDSLKLELRRLDYKIKGMENTAVRGDDREYGLSIEQLSEVQRILKKDPTASVPPEFCKEDKNEEE